MPRLIRDPRLKAALAYALGLPSGIVVLMLEKHDAWVRFHAMQSVLAFGAAAFLYVLIPTVPVIGDIGAVRVAFSVAVACLWVMLMVKALQGDAYRLPYLGDLAQVMSSK